MGSYLQTYGIDDARRSRTIKGVLLGVLALLIAVAIAYLFFHNFPERRKVKRFLAEVNAHDYKAAYQEWGCTSDSPCPNYDFQRFMNDWGTKTGGSWKVASTDSCATFLTVNVQAPGSELESLAVQRKDASLGFAPAPECQERKWRWKQFLHRIFQHDSPPPPPRA
ncbi:MAG TPA: hypothetical protein VH351_20110 [Bryobacteraceae bacterium]|jgi:hypothetical protein|nr:hypothetical protein [Bryobacteraceae bacterium]